MKLTPEQICEVVRDSLVETYKHAEEYAEEGSPFSELELRDGIRALLSIYMAPSEFDEWERVNYYEDIYLGK